ncbi:MAG: SDR family NAD(P)-dependent oxidoreductase [Novosphingobium sp.]
MIDFNGKTVLVTGGGVGIGRAIADRFADSGARLLAAEIDPERAVSLRRSLDERGVEAEVCTADCRDRAAIEGVMAIARERWDGIDVLVNNVGDFLGIAKPFEQCSEEEVDALYAVNLKSVLTTTSAAIPLLRPGGSIISVSSIEAFRGIPMGAAYCAFKHGITGFTKALALELGPRGIRVNAIAPETTETPQVPVHAMIAPEHHDRIADWIPLGRFGQPADAANAALFLASDLAGWITGTTLHLDGGALAAGGWYRDPRGAWTNMPVISGNGFNF